MPPTLSIAPLPARITPCPIFRAIAEVRFQSNVAGSVLPGLIFGAIRERFPQQETLPQSQIPEIVRASNPALRYQPTVRFKGTDFILNVGAQAFSISYSGRAYPGWPAYQELFHWLIERFKPLGFIRTPERLGLRYLDFFRPPVVGKLQVDLFLGRESIINSPVQISYQLQRDGFGCLLRLNTAALVKLEAKQEQGIVLDMDVSFTLKQEAFFDLLVSGFDQAHDLQKRLFFRELIQPEFLSTLSPTFS